MQSLRTVGRRETNMQHVRKGLAVEGSVLGARQKHETIDPREETVMM